MGLVADYKDQYQHDYSKEYTDEVLLMKPVLEHMKEAIDEIRAILGEWVSVCEWVCCVWCSSK